MIRRRQGDLLFLLIVLSLSAGLSSGCQQVTDESDPGEVALNEVVQRESIERLPDEPDDLSQDLPAKVMEQLREHFPDYVLPMDAPTPETQQATEAVSQSRRRVKISGKPLAEAIYNNEIDSALRLIQSGEYNQDVYSDFNMLHLAAQRGQSRVCEKLLDAGLNVQRKNEPEYGPGRTPMQFAIQSGSVETAKLLLDRGAKLTPAFSGNKRSPHISLASLAITSGNPEMLRFLIDQGESADEPGLLYHSIATTQDSKKRLDFAMLLLSARESDFKPDPFVAAVEKGDMQLLELLEDKLAVNYSESHLRAAVVSNNLDVCRHVISKGAKANANPEIGKGLMRFALIDYRSPQLVDLIVKAGEAKKYCEQSEACTSYCNRNDFAHPLYHAVMQNDLSFCRYLIRDFSSNPGLWASLKYEPYEYENDIKYFQQGNTILFSAVFEDNADALKLLLKYTQRPGSEPVVDINAQNWCGNTVLHEAVNYGAARCVQLLLAAGADPTIAREDGCTPMHIAMQHDLMPHHHSHREMVKQSSKILPMLVSAAIAQGKEKWINVPNERGETILHRHARAGYPDNCRKLIALGADVNAHDKREQTPLHHAIHGTNEYLPPDERQRHIETCLVLVDSGTDLRQKDVEDYQRYARAAASRDLYQVFDALLKKGVEPDLSENAGQLLCSAARFRNQERIEQLLDWGVDINARGNEDSTALHHAARIKDLELCKFLIDHGADVNAKDVKGQTPLFEVFDRWAINPVHLQHPEHRRAAFPILQLLLKNGADVSVKTDGTTSTLFKGTVLEVFKHMPQEFRDEIQAH